VHDVTLDLPRDACLALVGETGSGKTTLVKSVAGLHRDYRGEVALEGQPLAASAKARPPGVRRSIQYVFQNPYGSLNPRRTVAQIIARPCELFDDTPAGTQVLEMLDRVRLARAVASRYPDEISGGERQRVALARALVCRPAVLVCDEVTSALDVRIQAAVVDLIAELQHELRIAVLFVTHNLALAGVIADQVAVMRDGRLVDVGDARQLLSAPRHAYTRQLLADAPSLSRG
jgi:peptide/nickel transport system ATP-binding protein